MNSQAAKRYACDRCREQKLRCPRDQQDGNSCDRCLRLGAFCITSSGRPLGRPPLQTSNISRGHALSSHSRRGSREQWQRVPSTSTNSNHLPLPTRNARGIGSSEPSTPSTHQPAHFESAFSIRMEDSDFLNDTSSSGDPSLNLSTSPLQFWSNTSVSGLDFGIISDIAEENGHKSIQNSTTNAEATEKDSRQSASLTSSTPVDDDYMTLLISAIGSISRNLAELKNQPGESWDPSLMRGPLFDENHYTFPCSSSMGFNSWEATLSVTTRFILLLQTMVPAHLSITPTRYSPPSLFMKLKLLSTYIQLGELFDTILTRISKCLQEEHRNPEPSQTPNWRPLPSQSFTTYIVMTMQILEHQLHTVEHVMGLPAECRLWSQKGAYGGVLGQEGSSVVTQTVMEQAQETFRSLKGIIHGIHDSLRDASNR